MHTCMSLQKRLLTLSIALISLSNPLFQLMEVVLGVRHFGRTLIQSSMTETKSFNSSQHAYVFETIV